MHWKNNFKPLRLMAQQKYTNRVTHYDNKTKRSYVVYYTLGGVKWVYGDQKSFTREKLKELFTKQVAYTVLRHWLFLSSKIQKSI